MILKISYLLWSLLHHLLLIYHLNKLTFRYISASASASSLDIGCVSGDCAASVVSPGAIFLRASGVCAKSASAPLGPINANLSIKSRATALSGD
jgi:hypothetical protein